MTVPNTNYQTSYTGDGVTTVFSFAWRLIDPTQMFVQVNGVTQSTSLYTVFQNTNGIGGTVTFNTAPPNGQSVLIQRNSDLLQTTTLQNNAALPPQVIQNMIDKMTIICQQISNLVSAGVTLTSSASTLTITGGGGTYNLDLTPTAVTPGMYTNCDLTVDQYGRLTSAVNGSSGGGGSGTVSAGTTGQLAYYASNGTVVSGESNITAAQMLALASTNVYVGNGSNQPQARALSGDATMTNTGVVTLKNTGPGVQTSANATVTIDAQGRVTALSAGSAGLFSAKFTSTAQTISAGGTLTLAHGLSGTPTLLYFALINTSAEGGYSVNDVVYGGNVCPSASTQPGVLFRSDATNVYVVFSSNASFAFDLLNKTTGVQFTATNTKWNLIVYAVV